ncbi:MAG: chromosome segregation protein SMC [Ignavibacteriales bacterium]|nr:MAG: chromosome segregation protein SMC [Ignavibacteriales bacterium]
MYLSKMEIFGFKSFANKTPINLTKGITGIVGPNGCGKTNIVDALRWCLGEQKSSTLRSDKMENVIFNGTRNKKPMGMAEVSLTLVNDKGILPTEYSEVTITRRIFRSGESEYLLNKNICRLKDITNLFMDTGMGTNAYSVIELKMIETILSNKAEERRRMFEEAAGVNKYKLRRRLALKKLDEVKADLTRVNDIVSEVDKTVRSLERQAKRADKYNQIQSVLREKELDLAEREWALFTRNKNNAQDRIASLNERKSIVDSDIRRIETELIKFRTQIEEIEKRLRDKRYQIRQQNDKIHESQKIISVSEERLNSFENNLLRYHEELEDFQQQKEYALIQIDESQNKLVQLVEEIEKKTSELVGFDYEIKSRKEILESKRKVFKEKSETVLNKFRDLSSKENQLNNFQESRQRVDQSIQKLNQKIQTITNNIAKTVGFLEELQNEKENVDRKLKASEKEYAEKQSQKESLEKELGKLRSDEAEIKSSIHVLRDKIDFINTLITNLEGVSQGSKLLLESEGWTDNEKQIFADVGTTEEEFKYALEAALKPVLNNLLIQSTNELKNAVEYLKKNDLGKASFFVLETTAYRRNGIIGKFNKFLINRKRNKISKELGFVDWAFNPVKSDEKWKPYFNKVLSNYVIVRDLATAVSLSKKYNDFGFATLEGDLVEKDGIISAGSLPKMDDSIFGRKQMLEQLKAEFPKLENRLKSIQIKIEEKEKEISLINLKSLSEKGKLLLNDISNIEKQIAQLEFENKKASEEIDKSQDEIQELVGRSNQLDNQIENLNNQISASREEKKAEDLELQNIEAEVADLDHEYRSTLDRQNSLKIDLERLRGQKSSAENTLKSAEESKILTETNIAKREKDITTTSDDIELIKESISEKRIELAEIEKIREELISEERGIESELQSVRSESVGFENQLSELRKERESISDSVHESDLQVSEIKLRMENLLQDIQEDYALDIELKEFEDLDSFDFKERRSEVHELKEKIKGLGPINLLAYSEYEEEKERLDFLLKQRDDLVDSEKDLISSIKEINQTAQELFQSTFDQIKTSFQKIFRTLFDPGDEADLIMEDNVDPLEAKIEIIAKPKGKRPTSIELLSGGEKTLTATALLFAIYLVKPSPFCVLDEVDAPLDDANIDRFTRLIKEFSNNTQFIIVTHNKRTMESAENMYGVTMQEEGVSKLVGVQFKEDLPVI